jgi:hypothetical protein
MAARGPRSGPGQLLFRIVAYAALVVDALVIRAATHDPATFVLALVGLIAATLGIANAALVMLSDAAGDDADAAGRPGAADNAIPTPPETHVQVRERSSRRKRRGRSCLPRMLLLHRSGPRRAP